jgi:hypothetical protein
MVMHGELESMAAYCIRLFWHLTFLPEKKHKKVSLTTDTEGFT